MAPVLCLHQLPSLLCSFIFGNALYEFHSCNWCLLLVVMEGHHNECCLHHSNWRRCGPILQHLVSGEVLLFCVMVDMFQDPSWAANAWTHFLNSSCLHGICSLLIVKSVSISCLSFSANWVKKCMPISCVVVECSIPDIETSMELFSWAIFSLVFRFQFVGFCFWILWGEWWEGHEYGLRNSLNHGHGISWSDVLLGHKLSFIFDHRSLQEVNVPDAGRVEGWKVLWIASSLVHFYICSSVWFCVCIPMYLHNFLPV